MVTITPLKHNHGGCSILRLCLGAFFAFFVFAASAYAYGLMVAGTHYVYYQDPENPTYVLTLEQMKELYAKTPWEPVPLIGIAEIPLDADRFPEIIAFPTEEFEQQGEYCPKDTGQCPHYIIQVREKAAKTIGVIMAHAVARGDDIQNGFWTLKAFTDENALKAGIGQTYIYNPQKDAYIPAPQTKTERSGS